MVAYCPETSRTTGFETYDLLDSNITLKVTDEMTETAEDMDFTVSTLNSNQTPLPSLTWSLLVIMVSPFSQGMTYDQYRITRPGLALAISTNRTIWLLAGQLLR